MLRGRARVVDVGEGGELTVDITDMFTIPARDVDALVEDALRFAGALDGAAPRAALLPASAEMVPSSSGAPVGCRERRAAIRDDVPRARRCRAVLCRLPLTSDVCRLVLASGNGP